MKVLVLGATGFVGSAVVESLISGGHAVVALIRNDRQLPMGVEPRIVDLSVPASLEGSITGDIAAVIHAASPGDDWEVEKASLSNLLKQLDGGDRAIIYISGVWVLGASPDEDHFGFDEYSPLDPITLVSGRGELERMVLDHEGARGVVVRPGIVHGRGSGIPAMMVSWAAEHGVGRFVGEQDDSKWPMFGVEDLAGLIVLTVESGEAKGVFHAVAECGVAVRDIAAAADIASGGDGRTELWPTRRGAGARRAVRWGSGISSNCSCSKISQSWLESDLVGIRSTLKQLKTFAREHTSEWVVKEFEKPISSKSSAVSNGLVLSAFPKVDEVPPTARTKVEESTQRRAHRPSHLAISPQAVIRPRTRFWLRGQRRIRGHHDGRPRRRGDRVVPASLARVAAPGRRVDESCRRSRVGCGVNSAQGAIATWVRTAKHTHAGALPDSRGQLRVTSVLELRLQVWSDEGGQGQRHPRTPRRGRSRMSGARSSRHPGDELHGAYHAVGKIRQVVAG